MTEYRTARDAKRLARTARPGDILYTIHRNKVTYPGAPREVYSEHVVGRSRGLSGAPMLEGPGYTSVEQLVLAHGPVTDQRPHGMRDMAEIVGNVCEPIPGASEGWRYFSSGEIDGLEKDVQRAAEDRKRNWGF